MKLRTVKTHKLTPMTKKLIFEAADTYKALYLYEGREHINQFCSALEQAQCANMAACLDEYGHQGLAAILKKGELNFFKYRVKTINLIAPWFTLPKLISKLEQSCVTSQGVDYLPKCAHEVLTKAKLAAYKKTPFKK
jgi:hypothetical protein